MRVIDVEQARRGQALVDRLAQASLSRADAARRFGITPQAVSERKNAGTLTAIRRGRESASPRGSSQTTAPCPTCIA